MVGQRRAHLDSEAHDVGSFAWGLRVVWCAREAAAGQQDDGQKRESAHQNDGPTSSTMIQAGCAADDDVSTVPADVASVSL